MGSCALGQDLVPGSSKNVSSYSVSVKGTDIFLTGFSRMFVFRDTGHIELKSLPSYGF